MGGLSNLPPGVTECMIPGNRPEDAEFDDAIEEIVRDAGDRGLNGYEVGKIWRIGFAEFRKRKKKREKERKK